MSTQQVKSKERVNQHGEVFTAEREVNAMLDLVHHETQRIDSRFLEPACGTGNFLIAILKRKLEVLKRQFGKLQYEYERNLVVAVGSLYGIDILEDNVAECRQRLLQACEAHYLQLFPKTHQPELVQVLAYVLERNILWGDALTLKTPKEPFKPIVFPEWTPINGVQIKRRDFTMHNLLGNQPIEGPNLFSDLGDEAFLPTPIRQFPPTHFMKLVGMEG